MKHTGKILVLAYPDTFVTMSTEWICKLLPLVGLGTREYLKAGHAALILIENETGLARYFDFGRYITPKGTGRVRGANTDVELKIPFKASFSKTNTLQNLDRFLLWLDAHPDKTHGNGRLLASVCDEIDYIKAESYIVKLQKKGSIPYGAFNKTGSNCSRFVTETILAATSEKKIIKALNFNKKFTPSTVGNVEKSALNRKVFEVYKGEIKPFMGSAFKENLKNYFDKKNTSMVNVSSSLKPIHNAHKLEGIGSGAWFEMLIEDFLPDNHFRIKRYNEKQELDFDGVFVSNKFNAALPFSFTYDSNCLYCHVLQQDKKLRLDYVMLFSEVNLQQKQHLA